MLRGGRGEPIRAERAIAQIIGEASSINHGFLGLLLRVLGLVKHIVNLSVESVDSRLQGTLVRVGTVVDVGHLIDSTTGFCKLHVSLLLGTVGRVQEGTGLLKLSLEGIGLALSKTTTLRDLLALTGFFLKGTFNLPELTLLE